MSGINRGDGCGERNSKEILIPTMDAAKIYKKTKATLLNQEVSDYFCAIDTYEKLGNTLMSIKYTLIRRPFWWNQRVLRLEK